MKKSYIYTVLLACLFACKSYYVRQNAEFSHFSLKEKNSDSASVKLISGYSTKLSAEMKQVLAVSSGVLNKDGSQNTLGNFVCDALKLAGEKEFGGKTVNITIANRGGLRNNLPKGDITKGAVFELMPFDNQLVMLTISGQKLKAGLKTLLVKKHSYWGLKLVVKNDSVVNCLVNDKPLDVNGSYNIVTSDYIANGGDSFNFLSAPINTFTSELKIRDAIISYCEELTKNNKQLIPYTDERLIETK